MNFLLIVIKKYEYLVKGGICIFISTLIGSIFGFNHQESLLIVLIFLIIKKEDEKK